MRGPVAVALFALLALSGCMTSLPGAVTDPHVAASAPALIDPLAAGGLAHESTPYDAGATTVGGPDANHSDYEYESRVRGHAWWPEPAGTYPTLLFLHGQHQTCALLDHEAPVMAIPPFPDCDNAEGVYTPYPSHLGYAYLGEHLASHGYVVLSILAHEINQRNGGDEVGMWARGELVLATLDALRDNAEGMPREVVARADLARVGLMGHSRGGEGVVTASHVNAARPTSERHALLGIVALAPTDFNERGVAGVALLSLVPYCDGDVSTLHGLRTFDRSRWLDDVAPKVQVLVRGTNHNFYNTRWYDETGLPVRPGDDAGFNPIGLAGACGREREMGGWRWTPEETQRQSIAHVAGFLRWTVGGETGLAPFYTGGALLPDGACPAASAPCDEEVVVTAVLPGRRPLAVVNATLPPSLGLEGFSEAEACEGADCAPSVYSSAWAARVAWSGGGTVILAFASPQDWTSFDAFAFRAAALAADSPSLPEYGLRIEIADDAGEVVEFDARELSTALEPTPDPRIETSVIGNVGISKHALQSVRVPLAGLDIDLTAVKEVRLVFEGEGRAILTDWLVQAEPDVVL